MSLSVVKTLVSVWLVVSAVPLLVFGQDAQQVTQSVLDQHKSADPTNSDRSLSEKSKRAEVSISDVPLAKPPSPQTLERVHQLQVQRDVFIQRQVKSESTAEAAATEKSFHAFDTGMAKKAKKKASKDWEDTDSGKELRQLEREIAKAKKEESNARISDVPLARPKR